MREEGSVGLTEEGFEGHRKKEESLEGVSRGASGFLWRCFC